MLFPSQLAVIVVFPGAFVVIIASPPSMPNIEVLEMAATSGLDDVHTTGVSEDVCKIEAFPGSIFTVNLRFSPISAMSGELMKEMDDTGIYITLIVQETILPPQEAEKIPVPNCCVKDASALCKVICPVQ